MSAALRRLDLREALARQVDGRVSLPGVPGESITVSAWPSGRETTRFGVWCFDVEGEFEEVVGFCEAYPEDETVTLQWGCVALSPGSQTPRLACEDVARLLDAVAGTANDAGALRDAGLSVVSIEVERMVGPNLSATDTGWVAHGEVVLVVQLAGS